MGGWVLSCGGDCMRCRLICSGCSPVGHGDLGLPVAEGTTQVDLITTTVPAKHYGNCALCCTGNEVGGKIRHTSGQELT